MVLNEKKKLFVLSENGNNDSSRNVIPSMHVYKHAPCGPEFILIKSII
jgi:hypothetical protein